MTEKHREWEMVIEEDLAALSQRFHRHTLCGMRLLWLMSLPLLLWLFAMAGFTGVVNFNVELHSVIMMGVIFLIWLFFAPHNAYYAACKLRRGFGGIRRALAAFINKNILAVAGVEKADASLDDFLAESAGTMRNENFSSVAAGIFPTLGILGTFISIAISMPDFSAQTSEVLEQEISRLLGGVGTAFYVSIYGIFLSIWWIFFEKSGISRFERDVAELREVTRPFFWEKKEIEQTYYRKSLAHFEKLDTLYDTMASRDFVAEVNRTLEQRLHIFGQIIEREQQAAEALGKLMAQSGSLFERTMQEQTASAEALQRVGLGVERFAAQMREEDERMEQRRQTLSREYQHGVTVAETLGGEIARLSEALANLNAGNVKELYSGVLANIESMKQEIDRVGVQFDEHIRGFDAQFLEKLQRTLKLIDSETAQIVEQIARLNKSDGETR